MSCRNCSSESGVPNGCKSNGSCGTGGCNKLEVFDWLADVELPNGQSTYDIIEVRFKSSRKGFFHNLKGIPLQVGDAVIVEASPGYDIGIVSVVGELARIQVRKKTSNFKAHEARKIQRKANSEDLEKWRKYKDLEQKTMYKSRELASELALEMKISDVEYQGDGNKATFYYTADDRVDFRQLIRDLATEFKVRIEMKQIGVRQEASRLGGIGSCGRELCCSTWLTDFRSVSTASARYQQLSLNPQKLAGQCGKLKCCLNFELDSYLDALKAFPSADVKLKTKKGIAYHVKTDVFKRQMWYIQEEKDNPVSGGFIPLTPERVKEIIELNKQNKKPEDLKDYMVDIDIEEPDYTNVVGQDSLNRFEHVFKRKKKKKKKKGNSQNQQKTEAKDQQPKSNKQGNNSPKNRKKNNNNNNRQQNKKQQGNQKKTQAKNQNGGNQNKKKSSGKQGGNQGKQNNSRPRKPKNTKGGSQPKPKNKE
ncbi:MAG: hypothetical protein MI810_17130 [Flavobacteriales bacterium]|nr:hypothetical protein [Flavobacteriales bacterium]